MHKMKWDNTYTYFKEEVSSFTAVIVVNLIKCNKKYVAWGVAAIVYAVNFPLAGMLFGIDMIFFKIFNY